MRDKWLQLFIDQLILYESMATCADISVTSMVIDEKHPNCLSVGYNGTPHGIIHCTEIDEMIVNLSRKFSRDQLKAYFNADTLSAQGEELLSDYIKLYDNPDSRFILRKQLEILSKLDSRKYDALKENDKPTRLAVNTVHYKYEIHAEVNAMNKLFQLDLSDPRYSLMVNWSPCFECAKNIISRGIKKVYYRNEFISPFWKESSLKLLEMSGVELIRY